VITDFEKAQAENERLRKEAEKAHALLLAQYQDVLRTRAGRAVVADILNASGVLAGVFDKDPGVMAYSEGRRSIGLHVIDRCEYADYVKIMMEDKNARSSTDTTDA
jgi:hypothetical protein